MTNCQQPPPLPDRAIEATRKTMRKRKVVAVMLISTTVLVLVICLVTRGLMMAMRPSMAEAQAFADEHQKKEVDFQLKHEWYLDRKIALRLGIIEANSLTEYGKQFFTDLHDYNYGDSVDVHLAEPGMVTAFQITKVKPYKDNWMSGKGIKPGTELTGNNIQKTVAALECACIIYRWTISHPSLAQFHPSPSKYPNSSDLFRGQLQSNGDEYRYGFVCVALNKNGKWQAIPPELAATMRRSSWTDLENGGSVWIPGHPEERY